MITILCLTVSGKLSRQFSLPTPLNYSVANPTYTKGIEIQQAAITGKSWTNLLLAWLLGFQVFSSEVLAGSKISGAWREGESGT